MKRMIHPKRHRVLSAGRLALSFLVGVAAVATVGYSVEAFLDLTFKNHPLASAAISILLVGAAAWLVSYWQHDRLQRLVRSEARELDDEDIAARPFVIMGFSRLGRTPEDLQRLIPDMKAVLEGLSRAETAEKIGEICDNQKEWFTTLGGWQQGLRLLRFLRARGEVKAVYVIDNGTGQIGVFCRLLRACFPEIAVHTVPEGAEDGVKRLRIDRNYQPMPDYESYEYVTAAFDRAFERIMQDNNLPRAEAEAATYIDVTAGMKVFSIAAAIQTLNRDAIFLYVTTNTDSDRVATRPGGHAVLGYDAGAQFSLARH